ncbi:MAG: tetratricopeptide repeat protein [Thermoanaerobaculia bacterium]
MNSKHTLLSFVIGSSLAACGGAPAAGTHVDNAHAAHTSGGEVIRTAGTGQAVSQTAHQAFEETARTMRQHDEANNGRGDWNPGACNDVADRFQHAANEQPGGAFAEAWFNRGLTYERCGMTDQARTAFQRAIDVSQGHNYCRARVQLGVYQYRAHQLGEARASFESAVHDDPNCIEGYTNLAMIQREGGSADDRRAAVGNIRQALARDDRYIPALNQLALTYLAEAGDDPHSQRLMLAGIVCSQAVQVTAQHGTDMTADARSFVADIYNTWGLIDIKSGQIIRALGHFRQAFQLNPTMFEAWVNYGTINLSFRGYADAREAFQHATELHPNDYDSHIGLGVALRGLQQYPQAQAEYEHAQQIDANRPDSFYNIGVLYDSYINSGVPDLQRGIQFLEQFLAKAGSSPRFTDAITRAGNHIRNDCQAINALNAVAAMNAANPAPPASGEPASGAPASGAPSEAPAPATPPPAAPAAAGNPNAGLPAICARYPPPANPNRPAGHH